MNAEENQEGWREEEGRQAGSQLSKEERRRSGPEKEFSEFQMQCGIRKEADVSQFLRMQGFFFFLSRFTIYLKICTLVCNNSFLQLFHSAFRKNLFSGFGEC